MTATDFPLAVLGLVHIANRWRMHAPVAPDAEPTLSVWADGLASHPKGVLVTLAASAEVDGRVVWEGWSDYLARGARLEGAPGDAAGSSHGAVDAGALPERARWRLGADTGRRYAGVAGDANPIHLSKLTAKAFGFKRAIAHGMYTAARAVAALGPRVPEVHEIEVQFGKPLFLPSTVALRTSSTTPDDLAAAAGGPPGGTGRPGEALEHRRAGHRTRGGAVPARRIRGPGHRRRIRRQRQLGGPVSSTDPHPEDHARAIRIAERQDLFDELLRVAGVAPAPQVEQHSRAILKALVASAKADGHVDERERQLIEESVEGQLELEEIDHLDPHQQEQAHHEQGEEDRRGRRAADRPGEGRP